MRTRAGFGLVELIVALTILAVGVLGLAAAAVAAHRAFMTADALERAAGAAAVVLDSLLQQRAIGAGERTLHDATVRWTAVAGARGMTTIDVIVSVEDGNGRREVTFHAQQSDAAAH